MAKPPHSQFKRQSGGANCHGLCFYDRNEPALWSNQQHRTTCRGEQ